MGLNPAHAKWMLALLLAGSVAHAQVGSFAISQARARLPVITAYLDITDPAGQPVANVRSENLTATLGSRPLTVAEVVPFDTSGESVAYVFLIDISGSIKAPQFAQMKQACETWIQGMK